MGFVPGVLVQALPEPNGMVFNLCDENICKYSELVSDTKEKGGNIMTVSRSDNNHHTGSTLQATGKYILSGGLAVGDPLLALYDYGIIRVRKLPSAPIFSVAAFKSDHTIERAPKIRLFGQWMTDVGFVPDALATAKSEPGTITFTLQNEGIESYRELVKYARERNLKLFQVNREHRKPGPYIWVMGQCLSKAGFGIGDVLMAVYEYGLIKLQKLDFAELGF